MRIFKKLPYFCIFFLSFLTITRGLNAEVPSCENAADLKTGENWIQNEQTKVTVEGRDVFVDVLDFNTGNWNRLSISRLQGLITPDELMNPYREKYNRYYLFGEEAAVENVKTERINGTAVISFRTSIEDLWIDTEIRILGGNSFVFVKTAGKSSDSLVPHWSHSFHRTWERAKWWMPAMTHLAFDDPYKPGPSGLAAVEYRDSAKSPLSRKYCIAYRPGTDRLWGFIWPPEDKQPSKPRRIHFQPGAIVNAYLDTPHILFAKITDIKKNEDTMNELGEKLFRQIVDFFK